MIDNVLFYNPRCSKSRQTLALLQEKGVDQQIKVIEYLKQPPSVAELPFLCDRLRVQPLAICRRKETVFQELELADDDARTAQEWLQIMVDNPILIERPLLVYRGKVALGRPPENVLAIL